MPDSIETRPFTIRPEQFAWPSFRISSERMVWMYALLLLAMTFLLRTGMAMAWPMAAMVATGIIALAFGIAFLRHRTFLSRPSNQEVYRDVRVSLKDEEVRQDFRNDSFLAIKLFAVRSFREIGDFYFVFASPRHWIVVPKTAFGSIAESQGFAARLREAAGKK